MVRFSRLVLATISALAVVSAWDISNEEHRSRCQAPSERALDGSRTLFVSASDPKAQFKTVQSGGFHEPYVFRNTS
jgi:hypothetical protein